MNTTLSIIGAGKVGQTLGKLWAASGTLQILDVYNRTPASAQSAAEFIGRGRPVNEFALLRPADIYLIATPDDQITTACSALAEANLLSPESLVFHCSGALPSTILEAAIACGAAVASAHPIRSFASPEQVAASFSGTWCGMEGDRRALDILAPAFEAVGAIPVMIGTAEKIHYHAGAVFACNYLVTLLDVAVQSYGRAGIAPDAALQMMAPLVRETVENTLRMGTTAALTGPIARGDMETASKQWQAVADANAAHGKLYGQLMQLTAELAARRQPPAK